MTDPVRKSIVDYLEVVTGSDKAASLLADNIFAPHYKVIKPADPKNRDRIKADLINGMHPHIARSLFIIKKWFTNIFNEQEPLVEKKCQNIVYRILEARSKKLMERVAERWAKCEQKTEKMLQELVDEVNHYELTGSDAEYPLQAHEIPLRKYQRITFIEEEIILSFLYPRMDYNVSTMQNHLLKLPFSVHPSSKKISVPMFSHEIDLFDPDNCVTIEGLVKELEQLDREKELVRDNNLQNAHKTHLTLHLSSMESFCSEL